MRLPRLMTQRTMMAVAILAFSLAAGRHINRLARISSIRQHMDFVHATSEQRFRKASSVTRMSAASTHRDAGLRPLDLEAERRRAAWQIRMAEYHRMLSLKYDRAAWYPWAKVSTNQPRPK
ncbi:hypothetical protein SAMN05444166_4681 [Singulisphaera sp. GP187]|nr:hypothetical protein SAMN05444166_4681 [Singulisphaera sp. GP187]